VKRYELGATDLSQYDQLTDEERIAWLNPKQGSYHSYHVERMGADTFRWRDSREAKFYIGTESELLNALLYLKPRQVDPNYLEASQRTQVLSILSQDEVDDLLKDL
jgi:hypothetical protein